MVTIGKQMPPSELSIKFGARGGSLDERAWGILHRLAQENDRTWLEVLLQKPRFPFSDEPLRNDAANLIRLAGDEHSMIGTHLVGDSPLRR